jgi:hypothetical protein
MKMKKLGVITAVAIGFAAVGSAMAAGKLMPGSSKEGTPAAIDPNPGNPNNPNDECDVVSLTGSGTRLESGVIVGSETLTIIATGEQIPLAFTAVPLGITDFQVGDGRTTLVSSHDFKGVNDRRIDFTTFDELKTIPLQNDPTCGQGECGLVFKLVLEKGVGDYNCGEIVSGYDPTTNSFTSTVHGATLQLNSLGKLCKCRLSGNN